MIAGSAAVLFLAAGVVAADYFGLFGTSEHLDRDVAHLHFKFVDSSSKRPIDGVHVVCTRPGTESACTERRGRRAGRVEASLSLVRVVRAGLFFSHEQSVHISDSGIISIMFVHPGYRRKRMMLDAEGVRHAAEEPVVVELPAADPQGE